MRPAFLVYGTAIRKPVVCATFTRAPVSACQVDPRFLVKENRKIWAGYQEEEKPHKMVDTDFFRAQRKKMEAKRVATLNLEWAQQRAEKERAEKQRMKLLEREYSRKVMEKIKLDERTAREKRREKELTISRENQRLAAEAKQAQLKLDEEEKLSAIKNAEYNKQKQQQWVELNKQRKAEIIINPFVAQLYSQIDQGKKLRAEQEEVNRIKIKGYRVKENQVQKIMNTDNAEELRAERKKIETIRVAKLNLDYAQQRAEKERAQKEKIKLQEQENNRKILEQLKMDETTAKQKRREMEVDIFRENQRLVAEAKQARLKLDEKDKLADLQNAEYNKKKQQQQKQLNMQRNAQTRRDPWLK